MPPRGRVANRVARRHTTCSLIPLAGLRRRYRSFGFYSAAPLIALIYLCCGGINIDLPLR